MLSEDSDIEMQSALPKKITKKMKRSPSDESLKKNQEAKKLTTKDMINQALVDLKSRKGTSLYAIKKYIEEKYKVDTEKLNYIIKKSIKTGVETGIIVQTKGIGASGSFKLAPMKENAEKKKKTKKSVKKSTKAENPDKPKKIKKAKTIEKDEEQKPKKKMEKPAKSMEKKEKSKKVSEKPNSEEPKMKKPKTSKTKMAKEMLTPAKKRSAMMKRKSIGSIIKPPKMKPRKG